MSHSQQLAKTLYLLGQLKKFQRHLAILGSGLLLAAILALGAGIFSPAFFVRPNAWFIIDGGVLLLATLALGLMLYWLKQQVIRPMAQLQAELGPIENKITQPSEKIDNQNPAIDPAQPPGKIDNHSFPAGGNPSGLTQTAQIEQGPAEDDYRRLVETLPHGIIIQREGNIVFINRAGAELLQAAEPAQLIGRPMLDFIHPDERKTVQRREQRVSAAKKEAPLAEEKLLRLDGREVTVEVARFPFVYQGQPAMQWVIHNLADRKQTEAEIVQHNRELTILQSTTVAITSSLDLRFVLDTVVQEMAKLFKVESCSIYEWDQVENTVFMAARYSSAGWWDSTLPAKVRRLADYPLTKWVLDEQIPYQMTIGQTNLDPAEFAYMRAEDIKTRMILPMVFQKRVVGLAELEDSREERSFSYQEISLAKLLANQAASAIENARLFAQAQQEIAERKQAEAALEEERALLAQRVAERTADLSKANAELARAARLKDEFLANMSHELRTPLNGILGSSEILQTGAFGPVNEKQIKYLRNIEESGSHLLALITDILDLAKSEAGRLELEIRPVVVAEVCQASLRLTKQLAHQKQIKVFQTFDQTVTRLPADELRLKQMLVNLLSNAIKFTLAGGQIGLEVTGNPAQQIVHFSVWDTGIGISQEDMQWLFRPFVQLDSGLGRQQGGTGLGLSLVSRMAELHGGSIMVESTVGQGSRFTISLPWPQQEQVDQKEREDGEKIQVLPGIVQILSKQAPLILLAEDNESNIDTFLDYLQLQGYRLVVARHGGEAIERAQEERPDVILMDIQMPGMDGLEATRRLRADPALTEVPIIALTALAMPGDRERCLAAGANEYLTKPVSLQGLATTIQNLLSANQE
ncbi:MAG: response regulator [Anaerolineae bacterium]|nr:response regulator [Anaerolineae bacterium]